VPPHAVPSLAQAWREPRGAPVTGVQVPSLPGTLQASHWPAQACVQQYPSAQIPEAHSVATLQVVPGSFFVTHTPPEQ
jgi:hypothetical protein